MDAVNVSSSHLSATGTLFTGASYLRSINCLGAATAGSLVFRNGGASGTVLLTVDVPGNANNINTINIPGPGILFDTDCHVTMPTGYNVTVFYGK
jgi:hypothetical protein